MNKYLFVMRGLPGAGKSTFVLNTFTGVDNLIVISPDELRRQEMHKALTKYRGSVEPLNEHKIWKIAFKLLEESLQKNKYTVFDATNTLERYLNQYNKLCKQYDVNLVIVSFEDVNIDVCKTRNAARMGISLVPENVIDRMNRQLGYGIQGETKNYIVSYKDFALQNYK
jgi:predicted kinase